MFLDILNRIQGCAIERSDVPYELANMIEGVQIWELCF